MQYSILVMGKNYLTPLGVIRSLGKTGYKVDMLYISRKINEAEILKASRYLQKIVIIDREDDNRVLTALMSDFNENDHQCVLFPTDDYSASFIDRFQDQLSESGYLYPYAKSTSVTELMDKTFQSNIARDIGFLTAKEWIVPLKDDPIIIPEQIPYPCFVKPLISAKGGKVGISKCSSRKELESALANMQKRDSNRSVLIQEFLNIMQEYTIGGVCNDQQVYIPAVIKKDHVAMFHRGVTLSGHLIDNRELGDCYEMIVKYLCSVHYVGMIDLEVLETDKGIYFGELNLRCGGPSYAYYLGGVNLPEMAVKAICGEPCKFTDGKVKLGEKFLNNKVAWEDYANLFLSRKELDQLFRNIPATLMFDKTDSGPEDVFNQIMPKQYRNYRKKLLIKKIIKAILPKTFIRQYKKLKG